MTEEPNSPINKGIVELMARAMASVDTATPWHEMTEADHHEYFMMARAAIPVSPIPRPQGEIERLQRNLKLTGITAGNFQHQAEAALIREAAALAQIERLTRERDEARAALARFKEIWMAPTQELIDNEDKARRAEAAESQIERLTKVENTDWLQGVIHAAMVSVGDCNRGRQEVSEFIARQLQAALSQSDKGNKTP